MREEIECNYVVWDEANWHIYCGYRNVIISHLVDSAEYTQRVVMTNSIASELTLFAHKFRRF